MNNMDNNKIFFTYIKDENGIKLSKVFIINGSEIAIEDFEIDKHGEMFKDFLSQNNISGDLLVSELEEKGIIDENTLDDEKLNKYINTMGGASLSGANGSTSDVPSTPIETTKERNTDFDTDDDYIESDEKYVEVEEEKSSSVGKRVLYGVLAAGTVVGGLALLHSCSNEH